MRSETPRHLLESGTATPMLTPGAEGGIQPSGFDGQERRETIDLRAIGTSTVRVLFVERGGRLYVIPSGASSRWSSRALKNGGCEAGRSGQPMLGYAASLVRDPGEARDVWANFCSKYGTDVCRSYFGNYPRTVVLDPHRAPSPRSVYELLEEEFDARADAYDTAVRARPLDRYLKDRAQELAAGSLLGLDPILEIGAGTGYHTLPLLRAGHHVTAVDISSRMLDLLGQRANRAGFSQSLTLKAGRLGELGAVLEAYPDGSFGGAFSAFGAFNLEPNMTQAAHSLARYIRPGGRLVFTSLNRPGAFPLVWDMILGKPRAALARLTEKIPPEWIGYALETYPRSPADWDRLLGPAFRRVQCDPVSVLAPPFDVPPAYRFLGTSGMAKFHRFDLALAQHSWLWMAAGWVFLTYVRNHAPPRTISPSRDSGD